MNRLRTSIAITTAILLLFSAVSCKKGGGPRGQKPPANEKQVVMVEELQPRELREYITVSGKLEGSGDVTMVSETSGSLMKLYKKLGDKVAKYERIGIVNNTEYGLRLAQAKAALKSAEAAVETARLNLTASETLFQRKVISQAEYNSAVVAVNSASAALEGANANLQAAQKAYDNSYLIAPAAGVISKLMVTEGQYLNFGTPIAFITDSSNLVIKTGVGESQITKLKQGLPADISINGSDQVYKGVISGLGLRPLPGAANYSVEIKLLSGNGLQPGIVVTARILSGTYKNQLYTSINNVIREYDRNYVFVIENNKAVRKEIQIGKVVGENVVIQSGINPGEKIVTTGSENLEDGTAVQIRS